MAKFCSWCGAPLEPGARWCGECGARVIESVTVDGSGPTDPMRGLDIVGGNPVPAQATARLDRDPAEQGPADTFDAVDSDAVGSSDAGASGGSGPHVPAVSGTARDAVAAPASGPQRKVSSGPISFDGTDTFVLPEEHETKRFGLDDDAAEAARRASRRRTAGIAAAVVLVVLVAGGVGVASYQIGAQQGEDEAQRSAEQQPADTSGGEASGVEAAGGEGAASSDAQAGQDSVKEPAAPTEDEIFASLSAAYDKLEGYSDRIVACVDEYNTYFLDKSMDARLAAKKTADAVKADLEADLEGLQAMDVPATSAYAADAANVAEMYECQIGRISALTDSWALDVTFDVPSEHKDEILAELAKDNEGGTNKYLTRFDEIYYSGEPTRK